MKNLQLTLEGTYSYRLYIDLWLFKIAQKRVTEDFSVVRKYPAETGDAVVKVNDMLSLHLKIRGTSIVAGLYLYENKIKETVYDATSGVINDMSLELPKIDFKGTKVNWKLKINLVD
jgi:hypothetical protein